MNQPVYHVPDFDAVARLAAVLEMLRPLPDRAWGRVTELSCRYSISRTRLYELRTEALQAIQHALAPKTAGRPAEGSSVTLDPAFLDRTITIWATHPGTVRGIQQGLQLLFGVARSTGYISETLAAAGAQAAQQNLQLTVPLPILAEADEIFQGRQPCLTVVDGRSFLVVNLTPVTARDATTWGVTFLDLQARGFQFQDLASDGGTGLLAGVRDAQLAIPLRPDLFHLLQDAHRVTQRLERTAYQALATAERARRAEREAQAPTRRRGPPLKVGVSRMSAEAEEAQAMQRYDVWVWLLSEIRQALEPVTCAGQLARVCEVRATLETAVELLAALGERSITAFAQRLREHLDALLAPLAWLEQQLAPVWSGLEAATQAFLVWAWQSRQALGLNLETDVPATLRPIFEVLTEALTLFHRSSSLAEAVHSWLRPHLQLHRGMPQWLCPLLQLFWNLHTFERGKRAGHSPAELAGAKNAPSLNEVLAQFFGSRPATQSA